MAQLTLDDRFQRGPPTRSSEDSHKWMSSEERRFVLWGLKEGWSAPRIGQALGVNPATVRRFRSRFSKEPQLLLDLDLYETVGRATNDEYRCPRLRRSGDNPQRNCAARPRTLRDGAVF